MKRMYFALIAAVVISVVFPQGNQAEELPMAGWNSYRGSGSDMTFSADGLGIRVSGRASNVKGSGGAGYVVESKPGEDLGLRGNRLIIRVSGTAGGEYPSGGLLKLEINGKPLRTSSPGKANMRDRDYIIPADGDYFFDISGISRITKIELVFFDCAVAKLKLQMFVE